MDFIRSYYFHPRRPSPITRWVGSCINRFEACSAFTHVMACTLAESPSDPLHRKLRPLRSLCSRFGCYRVERTSSRAGVAPAEVQRLSRRTPSPTVAADDKPKRVLGMLGFELRSGTCSPPPSATAAPHSDFRFATATIPNVLVQANGPIVISPIT